MHFARFACLFGLACASLLACDSEGDSDGDDDDGGAGSGAVGGSEAAGAGASGTGAAAAAGGAGSTAGGSAGTTTGGGTAAGASPGGTTSGSPGSGGSAGSAETSGTGGTGEAMGGNAGTGSADPCATALFCDDFESHATGQAPGGKWTQRTNSGTVAVDETRHASGSKAVKVATTGTGSSKTAYLRLQDASVFPVTGNSFYGRMLFYLESAPTSSVHWTFIQGGGLIAGQTYSALYRYGGQQPVGDGNQLMANYETPDSYSGNGPGSDCWHHANGKTVPVGTWSCAEWKFDGANNEMRFWLDGVALDDLSVTGTGQGCVNQPNDYPWTAPNFAMLDLGWESYQTDPDPRTLYIDDVVISTTPIGCPE